MSNIWFSTFDDKILKSEICRDRHPKLHREFLRLTEIEDMNSLRKLLSLDWYCNDAFISALYRRQTKIVELLLSHTCAEGLQVYLNLGICYLVEKRSIGQLNFFLELMENSNKFGTSRIMKDTLRFIVNKSACLTKAEKHDLLNRLLVWYHPSDYLFFHFVDILHLCEDEDVFEYFLQEVHFDHLPLVTYILEKYPKNFSLSWLIAKAVYMGSSLILRLMLEQGADANVRYPTNGLNFLQLAVKWGKIDNARVLVEYGANIQSVFERLDICAFMFKSPELADFVRSLIERGLIAATEDDPYLLSIKQNLFSLFDLLLQQENKKKLNRGCSLEHSQIREDEQGQLRLSERICLDYLSPDFLWELSDEEFFDNLYDSQTWSALHWAAYLDRRESFRMLLDRGASPHLETKCATRMTPLHIACSKGNIAIVDLILTVSK